MQTSEGWRNLFESWPQTLPKKGLLVTTFGESIPFCDFLISGAILLVDREIPDSSGGRKVMLAYEAISAIKIVQPMELGRFHVLGFQAPQ